MGGEKHFFRATCGVNHPQGKGSIDITALRAYSFDDCLKACVSFNKSGNVENTTCVLAHFNAHVGTDGGNCWLKSKIGSVVVNDNESTKNLQVEGELLD